MKNRFPRQKTAGRHRGFTLLEILAAIFILAIVVSMVMASFDGVFSNVDRINAGSDIYEMGNGALTRISADLNALHVMAYPRYVPPDMDADPNIYRLKGEVRNVSGQSFGWLRFTSLAHLPFNQEATEGIAEIIYYVRQLEDGQFVLQRSDKLYPYPEFEENESDPVVCEQLREFKLTFFDRQDRETEEWNSEDDDYEYATPKAIGIQLTIGSEETNYTFGTQITLPAYRYKPVKR